MSEPFLGEIRMFGGNFAPRGWAFCQGQILPINQNTALFALLGTQYGGDGRTTFALPNFQGNAAINYGQSSGLSSYNIGQTGGSLNVTLQTTEIPSHNHTPVADSQSGNSSLATGKLYGKAASRTLQLYGPAASSTAMGPGSVGANSGGQPHNNQQPYLVLTFIIALQGVFPPRQ